MINAHKARRVLDAEYLANGNPELEEVTQNDGGGAIVPRETRKGKSKITTLLLAELLDVLNL